MDLTPTRDKDVRPETLLQLVTNYQSEDVVKFAPLDVQHKITAFHREFARVVDRLSNAQVPDGQRKTITQCRREVQAEAEFAPGLKLLRYQHTTRATTMYEGAAEPLLEQETRSFSIDWTPKPFGPEPASEEAPEGRQGGEQRGDSRREDGR